MVLVEESLQGADHWFDAYRRAPIVMSLNVLTGDTPGLPPLSPRTARSRSPEGDAAVGPACHLRCTLVLCVALAGVEVMDQQWLAAAVLTGTAVVEALLAHQARGAVWVAPRRTSAQPS